MHPQTVTHLGAVVAASIIGFLGNESVAIVRIKVGKEIGSAALVADSYHARTDGWTSLAVLVGAVGVWLGYPKADPIIGLLITIAILGIVWQAAKEVRALDGVDPKLVEELKHAAAHIEGIKVTEVRARWLGHRLLAEVTIAVEPQTTVEKGQEIAMKVQQALKEHLPFLARAGVHVHPTGTLAEENTKTGHQHGSAHGTELDHHHV
jgi:cation diffusion facilitator family transporter